MKTHSLILHLDPAQMDRYNTWLNRYLEFLCYSIYTVYIWDITLLHNCIYFLHNILPCINNCFIFLFSQKTLLLFPPQTFQHGHMYWIIHLFCSFPCYMLPGALYSSTLIWTFGSRLNAFLCCLNLLLLNRIPFSHGLFHIPHQFIVTQLTPSFWNKYTSSSFRHCKWQWRRNKKAVEGF